MRSIDPAVMGVVPADVDTLKVSFILALKAAYRASCLIMTPRLLP
jgi:hypothetical protein